MQAKGINKMMYFWKRIIKFNLTVCKGRKITARNNYYVHTCISGANGVYFYVEYSFFDGIYCVYMLVIYA